MTRKRISEFEKLKEMYHCIIQKFSVEEEKLLGAMRAILKTSNEGEDLFVFLVLKRSLELANAQ